MRKYLFQQYWMFFYNMNRIIEFLLKSNFSLALNAALLTISFAQDIQHSFYWGLLVYFSVFALYGTHRLIKCKFGQLDNEWGSWYNENKYILFPLVIIHALGASYLLLFWFHIKWNSSLILVILLTSWYLIPYSKATIRRIPFIKAFIVAFVWTYILIIFPHQLSVSYPSELSFSVGFFFYFLHLAILSDIKDTHLDPLEWKTFPSVLGINRSKIVSILFAIVAFMFFIFSTVVPDSKWVIIVFYFIFWYFIERKTENSNFSYDKLFWVLTIIFFMIQLS